MALSSEQVHHIALLARIELDENDVQRYAAELSDILTHFEALSNVDTDNVEPTAHPLPLGNIMRPDEVRPSLPQDEALANAPESEDGYIRVRAVLE